MTDPAARNARDLDAELDWFTQLIDTRFKLYFGQDCDHGSVKEVEPPDLGASSSPYAELLRRHAMSFSERAALVLALVPHIRPRLLDPLFTRNAAFNRPFTEFGGLDAGPHGGFLPTAETLFFLLAGGDLAARFALEPLFDGDHFFARDDILRLAPPEAGRPRGQAVLQPGVDTLARLTTGRPRRPDFGSHFPARRIDCGLDWSDLVLHPGTRGQIGEIDAWLRHGDTLMHAWGMAAKLRPGYRCLFYGPPGTGKTLCACLLGKSTGHPVYRIDLALVVSKYIGETEKNLALVFDQAQHKGWILFFDEADALFGKRSETRDAHDRYANQEVAFLLQRIETFDGIAILASNQRENLDLAFARRFESVIYFPLPGPAERLQLWRQGVPAAAGLADDVDLEAIAGDHQLSGGSIMNAIRFASLRALQSGTGVIRRRDLLQGVQRELAKEGRAA